MFAEANRPRHLIVIIVASTRNKKGERVQSRARQGLGFVYFLEVERAGRKLVARLGRDGDS